jgi:hypothetical protein
MNSLLARSRVLKLGGAEVETPLLVPSISSKALGPIEIGHGRKKDELVPASKVHTDTFLRGIEEAVLVSAYDIHHRFLTDAEAFAGKFTSSPYAIPRCLFIDSGWYEKSVGPTSGQWYHEVGEALPFEEDDYLRIIDTLDQEVVAVIVGWDHAGTYESQIEAAQNMFGSRARFSSDVLLKPEGTRKHHDFSSLSISTAKKLSAFDVIGVTEKELGETILKRLATLSHLRSTLDEANVEAPIHVFGGLDPLMTPLMFAAGGEIFDGLGWLRYAFRDGLSIHRDSAVVLDSHFEKKLSVATTQLQLQNLDAITELSRSLKVFFHNDFAWDKLVRGELLKRAFEAVESARRTHGG